MNTDHHEGLIYKIDGYQAFCSCGWKSEVEDEIHEADRAMGKHLETVGVSK